MPPFIQALISKASSLLKAVTPGSKPRLLATNIPGVKHSSIKDRVLPLAMIVSKAIAVLVGVATLMAAGTWTVLVGTIISAPIVESERIIVQRASWSSGDAPVGEIVATIQEQRPVGFVERVSFELTQNSQENAIVLILAQPGSTYSAKVGGRLLVDGVPTRFTADRSIQPVQIMDSYLTLCVAGSCGTPGTPIEIPINQVIGSVKGTIHLSGIQAYSMPEFLE